MSGLEQLASRGGDLSRVAGVASFFVSRIDTEIDALLANAKLAYRDYKNLVAADRWLALSNLGAMPQRLLWASTGVKNPGCRDVMYVENRYLGPCVFRRIVLVYDPRDGKTAVKIDDILDDYRIEPDARQLERRADGAARLTPTYCNVHKHHKEFLVRFAEMPEVRSIEPEVP